MRKIFATLLALALLAGCLSIPALADDSFVYAVADPTYVRTGPGLDYAIVDRLTTGVYYPWGGSVFTDNRGVDWYDVYYSGGYGWVSSLHGNLSDSYTGYQPDTSYGNGTSIRATGDVNVRTGPGTGYDVVGVLYKGNTVPFTGHKQYDGNGRLWYQVTYYGTTGWISSAFAAIY